MTPRGERGSLDSVRAPRIALVRLVLAAATLTAIPAAAETPDAHPDRGAELFVQRRLVDARIFREQGKLEASERALRRALEADPQSAAAHRLLARVLEQQGRRGPAARHWMVADRLDPPPPPPPDTPLPVDSAGVAVVLVDGAVHSGAPDESARRPAPDVEADILARRLGARLPWATVMRADPPSVAEARASLQQHGARAAISLRTDRGFCGYSRKDGDFAVAWVRVASATARELVEPPSTVREVIENPPGGDACVPYVLSRALERALLETHALDATRRRESGEWPSPVLRALFPGLGRRVAVSIERGRARLATGRITQAADSFREALAVDPEDGDARAYLREAEETLAIVRSLEPVASEDPGATDDGDRDAEDLDFSLSPQQRAIAETLLVEEQRRRDELLAALLITEVADRPPPPEAVQTLRPVALPPADATGPQLARGRTEGEVQARALFTDDGHISTVYYFSTGADTPLLREEDTTQDGQPDRWIAYENGWRRDLWEDRTANGRPDVHVRYAAAGGPVERIEVDDDDDASPERVFHYNEGALTSEARDTDGDDLLDRFEIFDGQGRVVSRDEDLNADGKPDIRSRYRDGRLISREIEDPELLEALLAE